jgi:hypothetical protein
MTPELKAKWLAALRSDKYQQGEGALSQDGNFCCLGVLCDIAGYKWKKEVNTNYLTCSAGKFYIEKEVELKKLGLSLEIQEVCYSLNDGTVIKDTNPFKFELRRHSFKEIADWLEENLN